MTKKLAFVSMFASVFILSSGMAMGDERAIGNDDVWSRYALTVGGFFNAVDSNVRLGVEGLGVSIDVENLLGLNAGTTVFRAQ
jgi:hypothetical protein